MVYTPTIYSRNMVCSECDGTYFVTWEPLYKFSGDTLMIYEVYECDECGKFVLVEYRKVEGVEVVGNGYGGEEKD